MDLSSYLPLTGFDYRSRTDRELSAAARKGHRILPGVISSLAALNSTLPKDARRDSNLDLLASGNALCLFTGQQLGLFGGPLFTLSKILSTVRAAEVLSEELAVQVVPMFWLQSEDHDFFEISTASALTPSGEIRATSIKPFAAERTSLGDLSLPEEITSTVSEFGSTLDGYPFTPETVSLLTDAFRPARSLPESFAHFVASILPGSGILFFDPRKDPALFREFFREAISKRAQIETLLTNRSEVLQQRGLSEQVKLRKRSPLFFLHDRSGERFRVEERDGRFRAVNPESSTLLESWSEDELTELLKNSPERFSTSALLRPALQDSLFPTVGYVGGEAEVRYFAQASVVHEALLLPKPMIIPRNAFRVIDDRSDRLLRELSLTVDELGKPSTAEILAQRDLPSEFLPSTIREEIKRSFQPIEKLLTAAVTAVDPTLTGPVDKTVGKTHEMFENLLERYGKAIVRKSEVLNDRLSKLERFLKPELIEQERFFSLSFFYARFGPTLIETMKTTLEPLNPKTHEIRL